MFEKKIMIFDQKFPSLNVNNKKVFQYIAKILHTSSFKYVENKILWIFVADSIVYKISFTFIEKGDSIVLL